jgi:hypothetical protein
LICRRKKCRQTVVYLLHPHGIGATEDAIVQGLEWDLLLGELPLEIFVAIDAEFGRVREVGAEL